MVVGIFGVVVRGRVWVRQEGRGGSGEVDGVERVGRWMRVVIARRVHWWCALPDWARARERGIMVFKFPEEQPGKNVAIDVG